VTDLFLTSSPRAVSNPLFESTVLFSFVTNRCVINESESMSHASDRYVGC
jgi:hypothetical protein